MYQIWLGHGFCRRGQPVEGYKPGISKLGPCCSQPGNFRSDLAESLTWLALKLPGKIPCHRGQPACQRPKT
jgi:hypothetical protein